jgi:hypothetical protein
MSYAGSRIEHGRGVMPLDATGAGFRRVLVAISPVILFVIPLSTREASRRGAGEGSRS